VHIIVRKMKTEDTLKYNIEKYSHYKKFVETDNSFEVPDELAFMRPFIKTDEEKKWLESLLVNCRDLIRTCRILEIRFGFLDAETDSEETKVIGILKNIWIIECI